MNTISILSCGNLEIIGAAVRVALGVVLILAGGLKKLNRSDFKPFLSALGLPVNDVLAAGVSTLPFIEIFLGIVLIIGLWMTVEALSATLLILVTFTIVLVLLHNRDYQGNCACFGAADNYHIGKVQIARNTVLILATVFVLAQSLRQNCGNGTVPESIPLVLVTAIAFLGVGVLVYILASEVEAFLIVARQSVPPYTRTRRHV